MSVHPAHYQAIRLLLQQAAAQNQALHQTLGQLAQAFSGIAPQQAAAQQVAQQQHHGQGHYLTPQEDQALDHAMNTAQYDAQQAYQAAAAAAAGVSHHFAPRGPQARQRPNFVPPGAQPPPPPGFQPPPGAQSAYGMDLEQMFSTLGV